MNAKKESSRGSFFLHIPHSSHLLLIARILPLMTDLIESAAPVVISLASPEKEMPSSVLGKRKNMKSSSSSSESSPSKRNPRNPIALGDSESKQFDGLPLTNFMESLSKEQSGPVLAMASSGILTCGLCKVKSTYIYEPLTCKCLICILCLEKLQLNLLSATDQKQNNHLRSCAQCSTKYQLEVGGLIIDQFVFRDCNQNLDSCGKVSLWQTYRTKPDYGNRFEELKQINLRVLLAQGQKCRYGNFREQAQNFLLNSLKNRLWPCPYCHKNGVAYGLPAYLKLHLIFECTPDSDKKVDQLYDSSCPLVSWNEDKKDPAISQIQEQYQSGQLQSMETYRLMGSDLLSINCLKLYPTKCDYLEKTAALFQYQGQLSEAEALRKVVSLIAIGASLEDLYFNLETFYKTKNAKAADTQLWVNVSSVSDCASAIQKEKDFLDVTCI